MSTSAPVRRAVVLARGLGTRMRREDPAAGLAADQAAAADRGLKAMIPVGRPFLDYLLSGLADAGLEEACLVIGPEHEEVRDRYQREVPTRRIRVRFAVQPEPLGTADAVLAAQQCVGEEPFLVLNSDNYYPVEALRALRQHGAPALAGFRREALIRDSNIPPERIASYALLDTSPDGDLLGIVEKPGPEELAAAGDDPLVSMNLWAFGPEMFAACRDVPMSTRGEKEIPQAVQRAVRELGLRFRVVPADGGVLDLSHRGDIPAVKDRLAGVRVEL